MAKKNLGENTKPKLGSLISLDPLETETRTSKIIQEGSLGGIADEIHIDQNNAETIKAELKDSVHLEFGNEYWAGKLEQRAFNEAKKKADDQGFWGELGGFLAQAVVGEVILGSLEGIGYLMDFEHHYDYLSGGEADWGNWFSDLMAAGTEKVAEFAPIYTSPESQDRGFWENAMYTDGWWASNGVSVASAASLLIPVTGWVKGVELVGKGVKMAGTAAKTGKYGKAATQGVNLVEEVLKVAPKLNKNNKLVSRGIHQAVVSRHLENHMEASQVFKEKYEEFINQGFTEEEAKEAASAGASQTYKQGWAMLLTDIPQYIMLGRGFNPSKKILNKKLADAAGQSLTKTSRLNFGTYGSQFISEGFEEAYQFVIAEEGKHHADVVAGLGGGTTFQERLNGYMQDSELWTSAFFGGLGGLIFQAVGSDVNSKVQKTLFKNKETKITENQVRLKELLERKELIAGNVKAYYEALEAGDERSVEMAKSRIGFDIGVNAAAVGNWKYAKGNMQQLKNATPEEKKIYGIDEEFNINIDKHIEDAELAVHLYSNAVNKYQESTARSIAYRQYMIKKYEERLTETKSNSDKLRQDIPMINDLSPLGKTYFEQKLDLVGTERYIKAAEFRLKNTNLSTEQKSKLSEAISTGKDLLEIAKKELKEVDKKGFSKADKVAIKSLEGNFAEELSKSVSETKWLESLLEEYTDELITMTSSKFQKEVKTKEANTINDLKKGRKLANNQKQQQEDKDSLNNIKEDTSGERKPVTNENDGEALTEGIKKGNYTYEDLNTTQKKLVDEYKTTTSNKTTSVDTSKDDYKNNEENANTSNKEIPTNSDEEGDWSMGDDLSVFGNKTPEVTALAWKSYNNKLSTEGEKTEANKALSAFLESNESLNGITVRFEVNYDWIDKRLNTEGLRKEIKKYYEDLKKDIDSKVIPSGIGNVPIKGKLYRENTPVSYMNVNLEMNLHDIRFFFDPQGNPLTDNAEAQRTKLISDKTLILESLYKGIQIEAKLNPNKTNGNLNTGRDPEGKFLKNKLSNTLGDINKLEFIGASDSDFINSKKEVDSDLFHYSNKTPGAIYAKVKTANGSSFPLRLQVSNLTETESLVIWDIYKKLLEDKNLYNTRLATTEVGNKIINDLKSNNSPIINTINNHLELGSITVSELLNYFVFEGKNATEHLDESRLFIYPERKEGSNIIPATLAYGKNKVSLATLKSDEGRDAFIKHITTNRRRQVDLKQLADLKYKNYLNDNFILTTNAVPTPTKNIFVQPVITYSSDLTAVTEESKKDEGINNLDWDNFIDNNKVREEVIDKIADKIAAGEELSHRMQAIYTNFANRVEEVLKTKQKKEDPFDPETGNTFFDEFIDDSPKDDFDSFFLSEAKKDEEEGDTGVFKSIKPLRNNFINIGEEVEHIESLLPKEIAIELTPDYIQILKGGYVGVGLFQDGMIKLSKSAPAGTGYHEAFHAVFRTMNTEKQQQELIKETKDNFEVYSGRDLDKIKSDTGVKTDEEAINIFYEEILADEFSVYMMNPELSKVAYKYSSGIKGLFQKLADWIKYVFTNKITSRKLFRDIQIGEYKSKQPNITRSKVFSSVRHPHFSADEIREITLQLTYAAFSEVSTLSSTSQADLNRVDKTLRKAFKDADVAGNIEIKNRIKLLYSIDSKGKPELDKFWIREINSYVKHSLGLKEVIIEDNSELSEITDNEGGSFLKKSYQVSGKENATKNVKFLVAMVPDIKSFDKNTGKFIMNRSSLLGLPMFNDFGTTWNSLEKSLSGIVTINEGGKQQDGLELMKNTLRADFKFNPHYAFLLDRLENTSQEVQTQFFTTFSRQKGRYLDHYITGDPGNTMSNINASEIDKEYVITQTWASNFQKNFGISKEGKYEYDPNSIIKFKDLRAKFTDSLSSDIRKNKKLSIKSQTLFKQVLSNLGVHLSNKALSYYIDSKTLKGGSLTPEQRDLHAYKAINKDLINATNALLNASGTINLRNNLISNEGKFFKEDLAFAESQFRKIGGESSFVGPGGKIWTYQDNNSMSQTVSEFKQGDLRHLEDIQKSDYGRHSLWVNNLLDPDKGEQLRESFDLYLYGNYKKHNAGDIGDKASNLKPSDQFNDVVNKQLKGFYIGLAEADKGQQVYFKGPKLTNSYVFLKNGLPTLTNNNVTDILLGYLADELLRMRTAHTAIYGKYDIEGNLVEEGIPESKQLLYYHYNFDKQGNRIEGNAFKSFLFPNIDLIALGLKDSESGQLRPLTQDNFYKNEALVKLVNDSFLERVNNDLDLANTYGIIHRDNQGKYTNRTLDRQELEVRGQNIVGTIADYTLNSLIGNIEQTKLFNGDPALYKVKYKFEKDGVTLKPWSEQDLFGDFKKRIPAAVASGTNFRIYKDLNNIDVVRSKYSSAVVSNIDSIGSEFFTDPETGDFNKETISNISKNTGISSTELKKLFKPYLSVNVTDAQAWITLDSYRERMLGLGKWSNEHQEAYELTNKGINLPIGKVKLLAQPLKTVHAELMSMDGGIMSMQYNKQSEAVLLPFLTKDTPLDNLRKAMESQKVDHVIVLDGKKVGASGITDIDINGNVKTEKEIKLNPIWLSYKNLFLQQDLPSKGIKPTMVGTQGTKNVLSVVSLEDTYIDSETTGRDLINEYHKVISLLSNKGLADFKNSIKWEDGRLKTDVNGRPFYYDQLIESFENEVSTNHIEALESNIALDALPIKDKIQNKGNALLTKKAIKLKQLGGALIQLSDFGLVGTEVNLDSEVKNNIIWLKNPKEKLQPMSIKEETVNAAQVLIPHNKLTEALDKAGINYKNKTHKELKNLIDLDILKGLSYRIPNQGPSSNDAFEVVGILPPEVGDTMVAYSAITTKTGSDFDIDKAFIILPNFYYDKETASIKKVTYDRSSLDTTSPRGLENLRLDLMREMLLHPSAYASVMAPLDDPWLENLAKDLFPASTSSNPLEFFTGAEQMKNKNVFDNAKNLVGVIANHMTHHSLVLSENISFKDYYLGKGITTNIFNVKLHLKNNEYATTYAFDTLREATAFFKEDVSFTKDVIYIGEEGTTPQIYIVNEKNEINYFVKVTDIKGNTSLSNKLDEDGNKVDNTLGAFMNAIVDAAKDPYISRANINQITAGTTFMLVRAGVSREWIVSFIGQPIIRDYVNETFLQEGRFAERPTKEVKDPVTGKITIQKMKPIDVILDKYKIGGNVFDLLNLEVDVDFSNKTLESNIKNLDLDSHDVRVQQSHILALFLQWQKKSKDLGDIIRLAKADVEGATRNLTLAKLYENLLNKVVQEDKFININKAYGYSVDELGNITFDNSRMTGTYIKNGPLAAREIYKNLFLSSTPAFEDSMLSITNHAGYVYLTPNTEHESIATVVNKELYTAVASDTEFFNLSKTELNSLLKGNKDKPSIFTRIENAKTIYSSNLLISSLETNPVSPKSGHGKIYLPNNETTKQVKDELFLAWEELYKLDESLAKDLVKYSFISSGFSSGFGTFHDHIPMSKLEEGNFSDNIKNMISEFNDEGSLKEKEDKVFKHLYKDNRLVPVVNKEIVDILTSSENVEFKLEDGFILKQGNGDGYIAGKDASGNKIFKRFVKIVKPQIEVIAGIPEIVGHDFDLYQLYGYTKENAAIYIRTNKLGLNDKGNIIKEYSGDTNSSIYSKNNVTLSSDLQTHLNKEMSVGRGFTTTYAVSEFDPNIKNITDASSENRDYRLAFCLNR